MVDGQLAAYLGRGRQLLLTGCPKPSPIDRASRAHSPRGSPSSRAAAKGARADLLIGEIDGAPAAEHPLAPFLITAGFARSGLGYQVRRDRSEHRKPVLRLPTG